MKRCDCDRYHRAVEDFKVFTPGTINPFVPRNELPPEFCLKWVKNQVAASFDTFSFERPAILPKDGQGVEKSLSEELVAKYKPDKYDVIRQRYVDQSKALKAPYY